ncbi:MAG TPA: hypothetical protein VJP85_04505 [Candidatus Baltobacteraceae bacterium]|nr:hypothetical protein [Candidatus Baltobacteraceae bacterium]
MQLTYTSLTWSLATGGDPSLEACTKKFSTYAVSVTPSGILNPPPSVTPQYLFKENFYAAWIPLNPIGAGTAQVTVTDDKGQSATATITVTP